MRTPAELELICRHCRISLFVCVAGILLLMVALAITQARLFMYKQANVDLAHQLVAQTNGLAETCIATGPDVYVGLEWVEGELVCMEMQRRVRK